MSEFATVENRKQVVWQVESVDRAKAEAIREGLHEVMDPEIGLSVIELGLVREVVLEPEQAKVTMMMTTPFCPYAPALLEMTRKKTEEVAGVPTTIEMSMEVWDPSYMEEGAGADWGLF